MVKSVLLTMVLALICLNNVNRAIAEPLDLSQFRWKNRLLFLFAPSRNHPNFAALHDSLAAHKADIADRDMLVFEILESGQSSMNAKYIDPTAALSLRQMFKVDNGEFAVSLVGKDGGIKLNRRSQIRVKDIFTFIDAMPMRQEEIRQKSLTNGNATKLKDPQE
jgi:hypothetical protein